MSSTLTAAEQDAIASYAGPVQQIQRGQSSYGYVWDPKQNALVSTRPMSFNRCGNSSLEKRNERQRKAKAYRYAQAMQLLAEGKSNRAVARILNISPKTVRAYIVEAQR